MKTWILLAASILLAPIAVTGRSVDVSYSKDISPIFQAQCVMCHNSIDPHAGLALDEEFAWDQLVNVQSTEVYKMQRVKPGQPDKSYLVRKIEGTHMAVGGAGWRMPPPTHALIRMSERDKAAIRQWVLNGAPKN